MSQKKKILKYLKNNGSITPRDALDLCGSMRLASHIHTLRHTDGHNIETVYETSKGGSTYARYKYHEPVDVGESFNMFPSKKKTEQELYMERVKGLRFPR